MRLIDSSSILGKVDICMDYKSKVKELIEYPREANWYEFKTNWYEPAGIGEYISSLSNAAALEGREAGYLVWGVDNDTHEIIGTTFDYTVDVKNEPLEHYLARQVFPDNNFSFHEITVEGKRVVILDIPAATKVPTSFDNNRYLRIGSSKVNLNKYPERESNLFHVLRVGLPTICNTESENQELTFDKLFVYYASKGITLNKRTFKKNLGFLLDNGKYNMLAQLMSDNSGIPIRFAIFKGKDKTSTMYSVREFGNTCLLMSLDKVLEYGGVLNVPQADERERIVERKEIPLFDEEAFREAMINAFVHNQSVIFCGQFIHAILFCSLLLRLLSFDFSLRIFLAQAGQYLDAPEPGTYSTPHTVQFLAGIAAHRFVGMICNSSTKPMNL